MVGKTIRALDEHNFTDNFIILDKVMVEKEVKIYIDHNASARAGINLTDPENRSGEIPVTKYLCKRLTQSNQIQKEIILIHPSNIISVLD